WRRTVVGTRRFARRQDAWFRKDTRVRWVPTGTDAVAAWETPIRWAVSRVRPPRIPRSVTPPPGPPPRQNFWERTSHRSGPWRHDLFGLYFRDWDAAPGIDSGRPYDGDVELSCVKGHGTENDFVLVPDANGRLELTPEQVATLCNRRTGIGGDGGIRVVRTDTTDDTDGGAARARA